MNIQLKFPNGTMFEVPVSVIAEHRAAYFAHEFGSLEESLEQDTLPLFNSSPYDIVDWLQSNMDWDDIIDHAVLRSLGSGNYSEQFRNGEVEISC